MKTTPVIDIANPPAGAIPATVEQLAALGISPEEIAAGEARGKVRHAGPWRIPVSYRAIVEAKEYGDGYSTHVSRARFWPARTLSDVRQEGYQLEGRVSLAGRKVSAFTSSQLFELPDGRLVNVATIFARV